MMSVLKKAVLVFCGGLLVVSFGACKNEGPAERAGKNIDNSVKKVGEKIDQSVEKAGDKIEETGKKLKESTK